ncbi:MAG TPA: hypothetical protein VN802_05230 [Stellaceae bacterium]|nr:hypothetical protein [Stellaceae bacterium]
MRFPLLPMLALGLCGPAFAAGPAAPGAATLTQDGKLAVVGVPCAALSVAAGAGADYVPGVDVNGSSVAPADLPRVASPVTADAVTIEIDQHLAGQFGIPQTGIPYRGKAIAGYVTVRDGRAYFNGQPLGAGASDALVAACRAEKK